MRVLLRILLAALFGIVLLGAGAQAAGRQGGKAAARVHAMRGISLYHKGRYQPALKDLQKAEAAFHAPTHLLYIARCKRELGELEAAHDQFVQILLEDLTYDAPAAFERAQAEARKESARLRQRIATVLVEIEGAPADQVDVTLDGEPIPPPLRQFPIAITPARHVLKARTAGGGATAKTVTGRVGITQTVTLDLAVGDGDDLYDVMDAILDDEAADEEGGSAFPVWPTVTLGVGGATLLVGAILGGVALGDEDQDSETMGHTAIALVALGGTVAAAGAIWLTVDLVSGSSDDSSAEAHLHAKLGPGGAQLELHW